MWPLPLVLLPLTYFAQCDSEQTGSRSGGLLSLQFQMSALRPLSPLPPLRALPLLLLQSQCPEYQLSHGTLRKRDLTSYTQKGNEVIINFIF